MVASATAAGATLAEGANSFQVQEDDRAGNRSASATLIVVLDTKAPDAVTFVGVYVGFDAAAYPTDVNTRTKNTGTIGSTLVFDANGTVFDGVRIDGQSVPALDVQDGGTATWDGGKITSNNPASGTDAILVQAGGTLNLKGALEVTGNGASGIQIRNQGTLNVAPGVTFDCKTILPDGGGGTCGGNPLCPRGGAPSPRAYR